MFLITQSSPTLCDPMDCSPSGTSVQGDSPGKNTGVGCHALLQGIFPNWGSNLCLLCLLHWQEVPLLLSHQGSLTRIRPFIKILILTGVLREYSYQSLV